MTEDAKYMPCNACNVFSSKGKQAGWVIHLLGQFTLLSRRFACIQAFSGGWREPLVKKPEYRRNVETGE